MAETKKLIPKRRFKESQNAGYWKRLKLNDITNRYDNLRIPVSASDRVAGDIPYYGANGIQGYIEGYTHDGEFILVAEDGANDLKNYPVKCVNGKIWVNNHAHVLQAKEQISDNKFIGYAISQINMEPYLVGGGRAKLNANIMMEIYVNIPKDLDEQVQLGKYFENIDNLITLQQRKLEKIKSMKKAYLYEMFPAEGESKPKRRFKGFSDDWERCKLENGTVKIGDGLHGTPRYSESGNVFFVNGNNFVNGKILYTEETKCVTEQEQSPDDKLLNENTILMSINGTIGNLAFYEGEKIMLGKSAAYIIVRDFDKKFLYSYLQTNVIKNHFMNNLTGTTIKNLGLRTIRETQIFVPHIKEQNQIGTFFFNLDNLITLHQSKLDKLKNLKKAYLNEMFI